MDRLPNDGSPEHRTRLTTTQTAVVMACLTLVSKGFGFFRELILAGFYGTSYIVDAYVMAQGIPTILLSGILGSIGTAYTPIFSEITEKQGETAGKRFTDQIMSLVILLTIIVAAFGIVFSDQLVALFARKFDGRTSELTSFYLQIAFVCSIFMSILSVMTAYLRYRECFLQPIIAGYLFNIGIIAGVLASAYTDHHNLAFGLLLGYFLETAIVLVSAGRVGYHFRPNACLGEPVKQIFALAVPVFIGTSISQINSTVDRMLASGLQEGSVSALNYGVLLTNLILSLTTSIIATISYPKITKAASLGDWTFYNAVAERGFSVAIVITVPFSLGAVVFADQVVQVIYERGAFGGISTALTTDAFRFYSIGIAFMALSSLMAGVFNSLKEVKKVVAGSAVSIVANIVLNLALVGSMGHKGLALATSIAAAVNFVMLAVFLKRSHPYMQVLPERKKIVRIFEASAIAVSAAVMVYKLLTLLWMPRMAYLGLAVGTAVAVYLGLLKLLGIEEANILLTSIGKRGVQK